MTTIPSPTATITWMRRGVNMITGSVAKTRSSDPRTLLKTIVISSQTPAA